MGRKEDILAASNSLSEETRNMNVQQVLERATELYDMERFEEARPLLESCAESGEAHAQYLLGEIYYNRYYDGRGVKTDLEKALYWYEKAAVQGHDEAQSCCGVMYYNGEGVEEDREKSLYWFRKSAAQGNENSQFNLEELFDEFEPYGLEDSSDELVKPESRPEPKPELKQESKPERKSRPESELKQESGPEPKRESKLEPEKSAVVEPAPARMDTRQAEYIYSQALQLYNAGEYDAAFQHVAPAAEAGIVKAEVLYGRMYQKGQGTGESPEMALYWYERAAEQGEAFAQYLTGMMYQGGEGIAANISKALYWLEMAAAQGYQEAAEKKEYIENCHKYAQTYNEVLKLYEEEKWDAAFARLGPIAEAGIPAAQYLYGVMYFRGKGTDLSLEKARYWVEASAKQGNEKAWKLCGELYTLRPLRNVEKALYWYEKVAMQGDAGAQCKCYKLYDKESKAGKAKAQQWLEKALEQDYPEAQYERGYQLVKENPAQALCWFEKAGRQGNAYGQYWCAQMYYYGHGVGKNKSRAFEWFDKFSTNGDESTTMMCALLYQEVYKDSTGYELMDEWFKRKYGVSGEEARRIMEM